MRVYKLGAVPWARSQLVYHALAELGQEALVLCWPSEPYVCLGYHQDVEQEIDQSYCRAQGLPIFRREVGGGGVYLDRDQLFWQLIISPDNPAAPRRRDVFYRRFLGPVIAHYRELGVMAEFTPVSDVTVAGRKICGTGAGEVGPMWVFVGNLMLDFDRRAMARVIQAPDENFRRRFEAGMAAHLTSLAAELGPERAAGLDRAALMDALAAQFAQVLGPLAPAASDRELEAKVAQVGARMLAPDWLRFPRKASPVRRVKLRAGVFLEQREIRASKGLLRACYLLHDDRLRQVELAGQGVAADSGALAKLAAGLEGLAWPQAQARMETWLAQREDRGPPPAGDRLTGLGS
ncbi:MAG: biotin/lipoate A/B protein ligase family protein [Pseudomonadota bacterium]